MKVFRFTRINEKHIPEIRNYRTLWSSKLSNINSGLYGTILQTETTKNSIHVKKLQPLIKKILKTYTSKEIQFISNPINIEASAELWDHLDLVKTLHKHLTKLNIYKIKTQDGLIILK